MTERKPLWRRVATVAIAAVGLAILAGVAWVGVRGWLAQGELERARELSGQLEDAAASGNLPASIELAAAVEAHASSAEALTSDPVWRTAELVPGLGANLSAARVVSSGLSYVLTDAAIPMLEAADSLVTGIRRDDGGIDTALLAGEQGRMSAAREALVEVAQELDHVDPGALLAPVRSGLESLDEVVARLLPMATAFDDATRLLPSTLGEDGKRTILVMLQNNAELRTGGGISGSFIELTADRGRLELVSQADSGRFPEAASPVLDVPASTVALHGAQVGRFVQNATMPADFDLTARLVSRWWSTIADSRPDTILSVDPLVLRAVLEVTGPIKTSQGALSSDDIVDRLMVEPYMSLGPDAQTKLFKETAAKVFAELIEFDLDPVRLAAAVSGPIAEGRLSVWSAHESEQAILADTLLGGPAARQRAAGADAFAVYLNDATGGKMDSLLDVSITVGTADCRPDDRRDVLVALTLKSLAARDAATALPPSMTGGGHYGTRPGDIATNVSVSAPAGSYFGGVRSDGELLPSVNVEDAGLPVSAARVVLSPGESETIEFRFTAAEAGDISPVLMHTPMLREPAVDSAPATCG